MSSNPFVGTWKLVSFEMQGADGQVTYLFGKDAVGYIIYTPEGYVSVNMMSRARRPLASEDGTRLTDAERKEILDSCQSYCGRYEIVSRSGQIVHKSPG